MHPLEAKSFVPLLRLPPWSAERYTVSSKISMDFISFHKKRPNIGPDHVEYLYISKEIRCITNDSNFRISRLSKRVFVKRKSNNSYTFFGQYNYSILVNSC